MYKFLAPLSVSVLLLSGCGNSTPPSVLEPVPPPPAAPAAVHHVVPGTQGLMAMQRKLAEKGYYSGKIDGRKGPQTHAALLRYQQDIGIQPVTGEPNDQTWSALGLSEGY